MWLGRSSFHSNNLTQLCFPRPFFRRGELNPTFEPEFLFQFPDSAVQMLRATLLDEKESGDVLGWADVSTRLLLDNLGASIDAPLTHTDPKKAKKFRAHGERLSFSASVLKEEEEDLERLLAAVAEEEAKMNLPEGGEQGEEKEQEELLDDIAAPPTMRELQAQEEVAKRQKSSPQSVQGSAMSPFSASSEVKRAFFFPTSALPCIACLIAK